MTTIIKTQNTRSVAIFEILMCFQYNTELYLTLTKRGNVQILQYICLAEFTRCNFFNVQSFDKTTKKVLHNVKTFSGDTPYTGMLVSLKYEIAFPNKTLANNFLLDMEPKFQEVINILKKETDNINLLDYIGARSVVKLYFNDASFVSAISFVKNITQNKEKKEENN